MRSCDNKRTLITGLMSSLRGWNQKHKGVSLWFHLQKYKSRSQLIRDFEVGSASIINQTHVQTLMDKAKFTSAEGYVCLNQVSQHRDRRPPLCGEGIMRSLWELDISTVVLNDRLSLAWPQLLFQNCVCSEKQVSLVTMSHCIRGELLPHLLVCHWI
jgi:hypothetical protein